MSRLAAWVNVGWMVIVVCLAIGAAWLLRFEGDHGLYYLDRWTGELVDGAALGGDYRYDLRQVPTAPAGAFDDLIPKEE